MTPTFFNQEELVKLNLLLGNCLDELLRRLKIDVYRINNGFSGKCCIHNGDNAGAFNITDNNHPTYPNRWKCFTHSCDSIFKSSLLGLIRAKISKDTYGWRGAGDRVAPFSQVIQWTENFLGIKSHEVNLVFDTLTPKAPPKVTFNELLGYPRAKMREKLLIPCPYFLRKGFDKRTLLRYDVGVATDPLTKFYNRTVCAVFDKGAQTLVGISGRSIFEKCPSCKLYHSPNHRCPNKPEYFGVYAKWRHSRAFNVSHHLYNFWDEFDLIQDMRSIYLVESIGNTLKLVQNGIRNVVCSFGCNLSQDQCNLLNKAKVVKIILLYDNDEAGIKGSEKIISQYGNFYNIKTLFPCDKNKDFCDLTDREIQCKIIPQIIKK